MTKKEKIANGIPKPLKGNRKRNAANKRKDANKTEVFASLRKYGSSAQKMRLIIDQIRNKNVADALNILEIMNKMPAVDVQKLVKSAIDNYEKKLPNLFNPESVIISQINADGGSFLKRVRPAPQGRAYRVRKRTCHVTIRLAETTR